MNKIVSILLTAALIIGGLAGCGTNDEAQLDNTTLNNKTRQIGFYSNEKRWDNNNAFTNVNDRGFNDQRMFDQMDAGNVGRNIGDQAGAYSKGTRYGYNDLNYHGQLNTTLNGQPTTSYHNGHENVIAQKISDRIEHLPNVKDVSTIINGDTIVVAIDTNNNNDSAVEGEVRRIVKGMANGWNVQVVTNKGILERIGNKNRAPLNNE